MPYLATIYIDAQPFTAMVTIAVLVPKNGKVATVISNIIEAEPIPFISWNQGVHFNRIVYTRTQPDESRYHKVIECGVVVVAATLLITFEPISFPRKRISCN